MSVPKVVINSFWTHFWSWITILSSKIGVLTAVFEKLRFTYFHWTEVVLFLTTYTNNVDLISNATTQTQGMQFPNKLYYPSVLQ